jgi:hypothetical protein
VLSSAPRFPVNVTVKSARNTSVNIDGERIVFSPNQVCGLPFIFSLAHRKCRVHHCS